MYWACTRVIDVAAADDVRGSRERRVDGRADRPSRRRSRRCRGTRPRPRGAAGPAGLARWPSPRAAARSRSGPARRRPRPGPPSRRPRRRRDRPRTARGRGRAPGCAGANIGEPSGRVRARVVRVEPSPAWAKSSPVKTARTPGRLGAPRTRRGARMRAWACTDRTTTAWAWPGRLTSSWKRPPPRSRRTSSNRLTACPTPNGPITRPPTGNDPGHGRRSLRGGRRAASVAPSEAPAPRRRSRWTTPAPADRRGAMPRRVARRGRDGDPRADLVAARPRLRLERFSRVAKERADAAADERVEEAPVEVEADPPGLRHRRPVRQAARAQDRHPLRPPVHRAPDRDPERVAAMERRRQPRETVDDDRDDGQRRAEQVERHHHPVVELRAPRTRRGRRPRRFPSASARPRRASPRTRRRGIFTNSSSVGPQYSSAKPDAEGRHVVEEEVGPVLGRDDDQDVGSRGLEPRAELAVRAEHGLGVGGGGSAGRPVIPGAWLAANAATRLTASSRGASPGSRESSRRASPRAGPGGASARPSGRARGSPSRGPPVARPRVRS